MSTANLKNAIFYNTNLKDTKLEYGNFEGSTVNISQKNNYILNHFKYLL